MLWLIQKMQNESAFDEIIRLLNVYSIDYKIVKALSFSNKIVDANINLNGQDLAEIPELKIEDNQPIFVLGSYTLAKIAKQKKWKPGAFLNNNFNYEKWNEKWSKENLLNGSAIIDTISKIDIPFEKFFTRPLHDTKSFSGSIFNKNDFLYWRNQILQAKSKQLNANTKIIVSELKTIYYEVRFFVVNKKIITQSIYKRGDKVIYDNLVSSDIINWTQSMVDKWCPAKAFVIDVAETPEGFKIIEVNNINSSGFYNCDLNKFVIAIETMK